MRKEKECIACNNIVSKNRSLLIQYNVSTGYEYNGEEEESAEPEELLVREYVCCEKCLKARMKEIYNDYQTSITVRYPYRVIADMDIPMELKWNDEDICPESNRDVIILDTQGVEHDHHYWGRHCFYEYVDNEDGTRDGFPSRYDIKQWKYK